MKLQTLFGICTIAFLSGCVNTPNTKALVTPYGVVGVHSFAPVQRSPDTIKSVDFPVLAKEQSATSNAANPKRLN